MQEKRKMNSQIPWKIGIPAVTVSYGTVLAALAAIDGPLFRMALNDLLVLAGIVSFVALIILWITKTVSTHRRKR